MKETKQNKPAKENWEERELEDLLHYIDDAGFELTDYECEDMLKSFISTLLSAQKKEIIEEIAEYSGINDIQTKELIEIIKRLNETRGI